MEKRNENGFTSKIMCFTAPIVSVSRHGEKTNYLLGESITTLQIVVCCRKLLDMKPTLFITKLSEPICYCLIENEIHLNPHHQKPILRHLLEV